MSRVAPGSPAARPASKAAKTAAVGTATGGVTRRTPGGRADGSGASGVHALAATLDEGGPAGEEERHVRAETRGDLGPGDRIELGSPGLERAVERRRGVAAAPAEAGRDGDPLVEPHGQGRSGPAAGPAGPPRSDPAGADRPARLGDRPQDEVVGGRPGVVALDVEGVASRPARRASVSTSARSSGTMTEWSSWKPSGRRPTTASVRLSLAGASRTTGARRRAASGAPGGRSRSAGRRRPTSPSASASLIARRTVRWRRPRRSGPIGPSAARRRQPLPDREGLRPPVGAMPAAASAASTRAGAIGSCRGQHVVDHLAPLAERRLDEPPQLVVLVRRRAPRAAPSAAGSRTMTADSTLGSGSNAPGGTRNAIRTAGVVLDEDRQVAHRAGRRGDPLGHLALDHEHGPVRARRLAEQPVEDRARHVVRQVGHDVVRRGEQGRELLVEGVAFDEAQPAGRAGVGLRAGDAARRTSSAAARPAPGRARRPSPPRRPRAGPR